PLPKEPETTTQAASSPATSPATSTAMTAQSPATAPATSNAVTQQSPATSPADKAAAPAPAPTNVVSTPATVLAPATVQESSVSDSMNGFNSRTWLVGGLLVAGILLLVWVVFSEFRRRVSVSVYRSPAPASGPSFDEIEPETAVEKMAAPKRLAGGPPQVSLHLKASEPSVRRGAVPLSKPSRPFGTNGGITMVGPSVENFVPRTPAPEQKAELVEMPIVEPISDIVPEPEKPAAADFETVSAPATELAEFSSVGEPQVIEAAPPEIIESFADIPPASKEEPVFAEAPAWTEPATPEPVWTPIAPEPSWTPVAFEPATPVFETSAPEPVAENAASFESVSEPVVIEPEIAPQPVAEISAAAEEPVAQGPLIPYQVPAFETESPMAEITKPEPEELPAHLAKGVVAGTSM